MIPFQLGPTAGSGCWRPWGWEQIKTYVAINIICLDYNCLEWENWRMHLILLLFTFHEPEQYIYIITSDKIPISNIYISYLGPLHVLIDTLCIVPVISSAFVICCCCPLSSYFGNVLLIVSGFCLGIYLIACRWLLSRHTDHRILGFPGFAFRPRTVKWF